MKILDDLNKEVVDKTCNHQCSRCGQCCGLFLPITEKEIHVVKDYVEKNNIEPVERINKMTGAFEAHCCFLDKVNHKCLIYPVRPYVCRAFKCDHKDWRKKRDEYDKRGKYNSIHSKQITLATFDDKIYGNYNPILRFILSVCYEETGSLDSDLILQALKSFNRLDLLEHFDAIDTEGNRHKGTDFLKRS